MLAVVLVGSCAAGVSSRGFGLEAPVGSQNGSTINALYYNRSKSVLAVAQFLTMWPCRLLLVTTHHSADEAPIETWSSLLWPKANSSNVVSWKVEQVSDGARHTWPGYCFCESGPETVASVAHVKQGITRCRCLCIAAM